MRKFKFINKVGIEMEGGWRTKPRSWKRDGSVSAGSNSGEIASRPLATPTTVKAWIKRYKPDHSNATCGLHVHISLKDSSLYTKLTESSFNEFFKSELDKWGKANCPDNDIFWNRLEGKNTYCKRSFAPGLQLMGLEDRYTQINFCARRLHGTVEFRVLPMFDNLEIIQSAVLKIAEIVEDYLTYNFRLSPIKIESEHVDTDEDIDLDLSDHLDLQNEYIEDASSIDAVLEYSF